MKKNLSFFKYKFNEWSRDFTSLASPLILLFVPFVVMGPIEMFWTLLCLLLINELLGSLIKILFPKKRPNGQTYKNILEKIDAGSFPSLHSSRITIVYLTLFHFSSFNFMKVLFLVVIPIVMFSRINLKKHFWIDIFGGFVIGFVIWYIAFFGMN